MREGNKFVQPGGNRSAALGPCDRGTNTKEEWACPKDAIPASRDEICGEFWIAWLFPAFLPGPTATHLRTSPYCTPEATLVPVWTRVRNQSKVSRKGGVSGPAVSPLGWSRPVRIVRVGEVGVLIGVNTYREREREGDREITPNKVDNARNTKHYRPKKQKEAKLKKTK